MFHYQPSLAELCPVIVVEEPSFAVSAEMLQAHDPDSRVWSQDAIETAVEITARFQGQRCLPGKALTVLREINVNDQVRLGKAVYAAFCRMEHVPLHVVKPGESCRKALHNAMVGQERAVTVVSRAIATLRAGFSDPQRPFATYLFAGQRRW